jgi:plasmid stabilization system protein ParE
MAQVVWAPSAVSDLKDITDYIAQHSPSRAASVATRLLGAVKPLQSSPRMGRRVPELGLDHIREIVSINPYRIIYVIHGRDCRVVHVFHGKRDLKDLLKADDLESL